MSSFYTISSSAAGFFKDKGSKFFSFAFPVTSLQEVRDRLGELHTKYHDARHYCYAWVTGLGEQKWRANDDGEPSHSAGDPILGQIRSFELTNVLVVVVRYFGGTKLGRPGLVNAYRQAAESALTKTTKKEIFEVVEVIVRFGYDDMSKVERLVEELEVEVIERRYAMACELEALVKKEMVAPLQDSLKENFEVKIEFR